MTVTKDRLRKIVISLVISSVIIGIYFSSPSSGWTKGNSELLATGNSWVDQYDWTILAAAQNYQWDPMLLKAQIALESYFNASAISLDTPCGGQGLGAHSLGLMQITHNCFPSFNVSLAFQPSYNVYFGVEILNSTLGYEQSHYSCSYGIIYMEMTLVAYNQGQSGVYGCNSYSSAGRHYLDAVLTWYETFAEEANYPNYFQHV